MDTPFNDRTQPIHIEDEMSSSFIDYSMSVIASRALPDVRDGLKPVHRRVLFAMRELGNTHSRAYKKSARVVGDVIGKYHPHGDTAVYDTIVRMAQEWSMRLPLVDGQGNFGSRDGDSAAAMRYTEVRMQRLAEELLADIDKDTVEFGPNYDESLEQPLVLPAKVPNLLLNGSTGIAVGMATNIPPHNLSELVGGLVAMIENPDITVEQLMQYIKGPDFPTHGMICGMSQIHSMYRTGRGLLRVRGRAHFEEMKSGKSRIVVTELPYTVNKAKLIESIAHLVQDKVVEGITDLRDESNSREPVRIIIELKAGVVPEVVLNNLYRHTQMQTTFGAIMLALVDGKPRILNLREMLGHFLKHRFEVITRRTRFELRKAEARAHILEGLKIALDHLDEVVRTIREANDREEAHRNLRAKFGLSDAQTKAILDMRLYQITGLEQHKIEEEYAAIMERIAYLKGLLADRRKIFDLIKDELLELKERYGDERRTELTHASDDLDIEDLIADEPCIITISHGGYIKRVPIDTYREQRRGGKGVSGMSTKDKDFVKHIFTASTHDRLMFFTAGGRVYIEKVYQIPEASRISRGKAIVNMLQLREDERVAAMIRVRELDDTLSLVMATERGVVKKSSLGAFHHVRRDGIIAINVDEDDALMEVLLTDGTRDLMLSTHQGMAIRFSETQLREMGRNTRGVRGIRLRDGDRVCSMLTIEEGAELLVCTTNGYGKRTPFDDYRRQSRGGYGLISIKTSERNGPVVSAMTAKNDEALMLITAKGKLVRTAVDTVSSISRNTQGVRLINLGTTDKLVAATTFVPEDDENAEDASDPAESPDTPQPEGDETKAGADATVEADAQEESEPKSEGETD